MLLCVQESDCYFHSVELVGELLLILLQQITLLHYFNRETILSLDGEIQELTVFQNQV